MADSKQAAYPTAKSCSGFVALLLEYFDGQLPWWLAPIQAILIPVSENELVLCREIQFQLLRSGIRSRIDESQGSLAKRVLFNHRLRPFSKLVIGKRDIESGIFNLEMRDKRHAADLLGIIAILQKECAMP